MRALRRLAVLVLAVVALLGWGAGSASAGGPTSAMLVNLDDGRAASVHVSGGGGYEALSKAFENLGGEAAGGSLTAQPNVRVVWFIHDVTAWRLQSVYLEKDGVRIATQESLDGGSVWDDTPTWSRLTGTAAAPVNTVLEELGVIGPVDAAKPAAADGAKEAAAPASTPAAATADGTRSPWLLAALAALLGAGAGLLVGRLGWGRADRHVERQLDPVAH